MTPLQLLGDVEDVAGDAALTVGGALRRLRKIAAKRDELIAREQAKVDAEKALAGPGAGPVRRRRRTAEEAVE